MPKPSNSREIPPPLELECLKALWRIEEGTVKDVREVVTESRNLAYTTVMTVLERLEKRGSVGRKKVGRSFVYKPVTGKQAMRRLAVDALLEVFFDGSEEELIEFLGAGPARPAPGFTTLPDDSGSLDPELL